MNPEEFKAKILSQFKDEDSAIRAIMLKTTADERRDDFFNFRPLAHYRGPDFIFSSTQCIDIETQRDDKDFVHFDVRFGELSDRADLNTYNLMEISDQRNTAFNTEILVEKVVCKDNKIIFALIGCRLMCEDYQFSLKEGLNIFEVTFDIASGKFDQYEKYIDVYCLQSLESNRDYVSNWYMDWVRSPKHEKIIHDYLVASGASNKTIALFSKHLNNPYGRYSQMYKMIEYLKDHC